MLVNVCWTLRVSASSSVDSAGTTSGSSLMRADEVGLLADPLVDLHALAALDEDAHRPVGHLEHARDRADDADVVELIGAGRLDLGVARGDHHEQAVAAEDVVDEADRALLADGERRDRVGQRHRLAQRQHGQDLGQRPRRADLDRALLVGRGDVDHPPRSASRVSTSIGTLRAVAPGRRSGSSMRSMPSR